MDLIDCSIENIIFQVNNGKKLICFGAGKALENFCDMFIEYHIEMYIECIADNNADLWGTEKTLHEKHIPIVSLSTISQEVCSSAIVLISCQYLHAIYEELVKDTRLAGSICCFYGFIIDKYSDMKLEHGLMDCDIVRDDHYEIPKVLHYCWFGHNPIPERYKEWMKSWKKYCPDYEIVEWNEDNYDVNQNEYMAEAYEAKKWGFVPDYARLDIIYKYGGIYLDTDVEIVCNLDELLHQKAFVGFQDEYAVSLGLGFGSIPKNPIFAQLRDDYNQIQFKINGKYNLIASPKYQTERLILCGLEPNGKFQQLQDLNVYPKVFFSPMNHYNRKVMMNDNTFMIHHFDGSWVEKKEKDEWKYFADVYRQIEKIKLLKLKSCSHY